MMMEAKVTYPSSRPEGEARSGETLPVTGKIPRLRYASLGMLETSSVSLTRRHLLELGIRRQDVLAVDDAPVLHVALAVLDADAAEIGAHGRLMVDRPVLDHAEGRQHGDAACRRDQLVLVERARLLDDGDRRHDGGVAHHRAQPRVIL